MAGVTGFFMKQQDMTERTGGSSLPYLGFSWFAMVMGLCGLSLAWSRAVPHRGAMALRLSQGLGWLAAGILVVLLLAQGLRWLKFPAAVQEDARHPVRHVFVAAFPSSLVLLATVWMAHHVVNPWIEALWMLGAIGLLLCTWVVLWRWLQEQLAMA